MRAARQVIGGLGNLMFKQAFIMGILLRGAIPDMYVQSSKYWKEFEKEVKQFFSEGIVPDPRIAIHIRRGDYLQADHFHTDLSKTDYYKRALQLFPNERFIVFCKDNQSENKDREDRLWCEEFLNALIPGQWEFAPFENKEHEDLNLMAGCKGLIMANSSFSWWGAFLNPDQNARIVCPSKWYEDDIQRTEILPNWIVI